MRSLLVYAMLCALGASAHAQPAEPAPEPAESAPAPIEAAPERTPVEPRVLHTPINQAWADRPLVITIAVENHGLLTDLAAIVRAADGTTHVLPFERSKTDTFEVTVPARLTAGRRLGYAIVSTDREGVERKHFASLDALHGVDLYGVGKTAQQRRQLARYDGQRNAVGATMELVGFGAHRGNRLLTEPPFGSQAVDVDRYSDRWQHYTVEWIYRPLTWLHDIRVRAGYMRAGAEESDGVRLQRGSAPGLNYGSAEATVELHRWFSVGGRFVLGANEAGFVTGLGVVGRIGDLTRTHVAVDYETIQDVGSRTDLRLHWTTLPRFPMALGVTFTTWPDSQADTANLLSYDLGMRIGSSTLLGLRAGVANRPESFNTGFTAGARVSYGF